MVSHGFVSAGLFLSVGVLYDRYHTRLLKYLGGFNYFMPIFSLFFLLLTLGNISFPGTISFIGELLILIGFFAKNMILTSVCVVAAILGAIFALWLYNRIFSGQIVRLRMILGCMKIGLLDQSLNLTRLWTYYFIDVNYREFLIFSPLIGMIFFFGINPFFLVNLYDFSFLVNFELNYNIF